MLNDQPVYIQVIAKFVIDRLICKLGNYEQLKNAAGWAMLLVILTTVLLFVTIENLP
jgi:hypothetical protein